MNYELITTIDIRGALATGVRDKRLRYRNFIANNNLPLVPPS